jgi:hypothetical protein
MNKKLLIILIISIIGIGLVSSSYFYQNEYSLKSLFTKKNMKTENMQPLSEETSRVFSCDTLPMVSFVYILSSGWTLGEQKQESLPSSDINTLCKVYLHFDKSEMSPIPHLYVRKTPVVKGVDIATMAVNSQGVHYVIHTTYDFDNKDLPNYGVDFYLPDYMVRVGLESYSKKEIEGVEVLNTDLFFKSIIESFKVRNIE